MYYLIYTNMVTTQNHMDILAQLNIDMQRPKTVKLRAEFLAAADGTNPEISDGSGWSPQARLHQLHPENMP